MYSAHLDPLKPLELEIERAGQAFLVQLVLPSGLSEWRSGPAPPGLLAFRLAQIITLAFALVVAYKRHTQPSALLGALLLASIATVSLALPMRMAVFWQIVPPVLRELLWVPFATSVAVGPLLFAFFAIFPRPAWPARRLGIALCLRRWSSHGTSPPGIKSRGRSVRRPESRTRAGRCSA